MSVGNVRSFPRPPCGQPDEGSTSEIGDLERREFCQRRLRQGKISPEQLKECCKWAEIIRATLWVSY